MLAPCDELTPGSFIPPSSVSCDAALKLLSQLWTYYGFTSLGLIVTEALLCHTCCAKRLLDGRNVSLAERVDVKPAFQEAEDLEAVEKSMIHMVPYMDLLLSTVVTLSQSSTKDDQNKFQCLPALGWSMPYK